MPIMDLDKGYRFNGSVYGPGKQIDVPEAVAQVAQANQPPESVSLDAPPPAPEVFAVEGVDAPVLERLAAAGFGSPEAIRAASDDELRAIEGVGAATVQKLRDGVKG